MNVSTYIAVEGWLAGEPQNLPNFPAAKQNLQNWRIVELFKIFSKELKNEYISIRQDQEDPFILQGCRKITYPTRKWLSDYYSNTSLSYVSIIGDFFQFISDLKN